MNRRLASLLGADPAVYFRLEAVLLYATASEGYATGQLLTQGALALPERVAERVIIELAAEQAISLVRRSPGGSYLHDRYAVADADRLRAVLNMAQAAAVILKELEGERPAENGFKLVATLPDGFAPIGTERLAPIATSLQRLVVGARESVTVLIPFFDQDGLDPISDALVAKARQGVPISLIVREVGDPRTVNHRVLKRFADRVLSDGVADQVKVYEFEHREDGRLSVTFHAKLVLVDGTKAYLGSANLTVNGMERFLELGALLEGPAVAALAAVVRGIKESEWTHPISLQGLRK